MRNEEIIRRLENINRSIVPQNKEFIEDSKAIMLAIEAVKADLRILWPVCNPGSSGKSFRMDRGQLTKFYR